MDSIKDDVEFICIVLKILPLKSNVSLKTFFFETSTQKFENNTKKKNKLDLSCV